MDRWPDRSDATRYRRELELIVDRPAARFAAWYEIFPRSQGTDPTRSATFREAEARLPAIAAMGFDTLYMTPIHPIGHTKRKGPNNTLVAGPNDPGSPYATGNETGGHDAIAPELGTLDDFRHFLEAARGTGARAGDGLRDPGVARSPVGQGAPGVVLSPPRRLDKVRREPAQEIRRHLPAELPNFGLEEPVGCLARCDRLLGRTWRTRLSRRQPAHQAAGLLGMADS